MYTAAFTYHELSDLAKAQDLVVTRADIDPSNHMLYVVCGNRNRIVIKLGRKDDGNQKVHRLLHLYASMDGEFFHPSRRGVLVPKVDYTKQHTWAATLLIGEVFEAAKVDLLAPPRVYSPSDIMAWKVSHHYLCKVCAYCDKKLKLPEVTIDHIIPTSRGGLHQPSNWTFSCKACNEDKADMTPEEFARVRRRRPA